MGISRHIMINTQEDLKIQFKNICNYHTHTLFCGHGEGEPIDYLNKAVELNFKVLGFSEHCVMPFPTFRHSIKDEKTYLYKVNALKGKTNIKVLAGFEVDYYPEFQEFYLDLKRKSDYLALSIHYVKYSVPDYHMHSILNYNNIDVLYAYKELAIQGIKSKLFTFFCHPDIFVNSYEEEIIQVSRSIINCAKEYDLPLELNVSQFFRYIDLYEESMPRYIFWEIASQKNVKVIINFDAHQPSKLDLEDYKAVYDFAKKLDLRLINELDILEKNESI